MKRLKKEYEGKLLSSGAIKEFNTNNITPEMIPFYERNGFSHIFEEVKVVNKKENSFDKAIREVNEYSKPKPKKKKK